jgi:hypothetical protein
MKAVRLSSRYHVLKCGFKVQILYEGARIKFKPSTILEGWYDIFYNEVYSATIPQAELKENYVVDSLLLMPA